MSVVFGPLGIVISGLPFLGGIFVSPTRFLVLTAWFALYGAAMGLVLTFAWRVECGLAGRRRAKRQSEEEYWIGDWNAVLERPVDPTVMLAGRRDHQPDPPSGSADLP